MNLKKIEFKDLPSEETPLDAATLNTMQDNIEECIFANKGIIELVGTEESPINANTIVNVGVYKISGSKENFYNNETETLILEVTLNNTALVQSITTSEGIALRVGQNVDNAWSFGEWDVLTGEKQVGYADEELEGTEKILIEASDFDGVDTVELADVVQTLESNETNKVPSVKAVNEVIKVNIVTGTESATNEYIDGKRVYVKKLYWKNLNHTTTELSLGLSNINIEDYKIIFERNITSNNIVDKEHSYYANGNEYSRAWIRNNSNLQIRCAESEYSANFNINLTLYYTKN